MKNDIYFSTDTEVNFGLRGEWGGEGRGRGEGDAEEGGFYALTVSS